MRKIVQLAAIGGCLLGVAPAQALPPSGREADALVQFVDRNARLVTVAIEDKSRVFEWTKKTAFFESGETVGAEVLKPGAAVRIRYQTPFFGKPFLSKVVIRKGFESPRAAGADARQRITSHRRR